VDYFHFSTVRQFIASSVWRSVYDLSFAVLVFLLSFHPFCQPAGATFATAYGQSLELIALLACYRLSLVYALLHVVL